MKEDTGSTPVFEGIADFVERHGGNRPISKILIANNGIGAVKAIRSIRRWAFEVLADENAVQFVVMATPEDLRANAEYIRMASEVVDVPGGSNNNNYANVSLIIDIAERRGVDAVWAGWGHASENPLLPDGLAATARKIKFIGPAGAPMRALGDKIGSTIIAQSAGVPCISWNGDDVRLEFDTTGGKIVEVSDELMKAGSVRTAEACESECERIGYPVMIKASEGGGGKGIRKCGSRTEIRDAFRQVESELPGSPIFVMRLAPRSRHLEVQLLADEYGTAIALNGRDCSIQRRHQKIIEEGPPLAAPPAVWARMEQAAINLARAVGYANAGTVEYLFTDDGQFYFLELNPRLQVEHPVTEMINKVNLPAMQLMVAMGIPMARIPDVRRIYGRDPFGASPIDFATATRQLAIGHCIAVRITAENPDVGFQPTSGGIHELNFRSTPDVWGYFSVDSSGLVHEFADSQFGHLFAQGGDREAARKSMIMALNELSIRGDIRTTVEYVEDLMRSEDFISNRIDTAWLDKRLASDKARREAPRREVPEDDGPARATAVAHAALIQAFQERTRQREAFVETLAMGHLPDASELLGTRSEVTLILDGVKYELIADQTGPATFALLQAGQATNYVEGSVRALADGGFLVTIGGRSRVAYTSHPPGGALRLILDRKTTLFSVEYDPSTLRCESAGKLAKKLVLDGAHVAVGDAYVELEVMKMFLPLRVGADGAGVLRWAKAEGVALEGGDVVATVELDNPSSVRKAKPFDGDFAEVVALGCSSAGVIAKSPAKAPPRALDGGGGGGPPPPSSSKPAGPQVTLRQAMATLHNILGGFASPANQRHLALSAFETALIDEALPLGEFDEARAVLRGRLPPKLGETLGAICASAETFDAAKILAAIDATEASLGGGGGGGGADESARTAFNGSVADLRRIAAQYIGGRDSRLVAATLELVRAFLAVESEFGSGAPFGETVARLRRAAAKSPEALAKLADACRARGVGTLRTACLTSGTDNARAKLVIQLLAICCRRLGRVDAALVPVLTELASLRDGASTSVALEAHRRLIEQSVPSRADTVQRVEKTLTTVAAAAPNSPLRAEAIADFVRGGAPIVRDAALHFFGSAMAPAIRAAAVETYVAKIYETHRISRFDHRTIAGARDDAAHTAATWTFQSEASMDLRPSMLMTDLVASAVRRSGSESALSWDGNLTPTKDLCSGDDGPPPPPSDGEDPQQQQQQQQQLLAMTMLSPKGRVKRQPNAGAFPSDVPRFGAFGVFPTFGEAEGGLDELLAAFPTGSPKVNVLHVACVDEVRDADEFVGLATAALRKRLGALNAASVRRVTFLMRREAVDGAAAAAAGTVRRSRAGSYEYVSQSSARGSSLGASSSSSKEPFADAGVPAIYTFRAKKDFAEDVLFRHIEPALAYHLDLIRLTNFSIELVETTQTLLSNVHCYEVLPKGAAALPKAQQRDQKRFFVRMVSMQTRFATADAERMLIEALAALELKVGADWARTRCAPKNHIFINLVTRNNMAEDAERIEAVVRDLASRYDDKIKRLGVAELEFKVLCPLCRGAEATSAVRIVATNPTGYVLHVETYVEVEKDGKVCFEALTAPTTAAAADEEAAAADDVASKKSPEWSAGSRHALDGCEVIVPYAVDAPFAKLRATAKASSDTLYCFDYLSLFDHALRAKWAAAGLPPPADLCSAVELVVVKRGGGGGATAPWVAGDAVDLVEVPRAPGLNDVGMVAWRVVLRTPEYPEGRPLVLIANDITKSAGSFGTREDVVFELASKHARALGCPRLYLAANSGARIGLAATVREKIRVAWKDDARPGEGFDYIYLDGPDYERLAKAGAVRGEIVTDPGALPAHRRAPGSPAVYRVTDVIGEERDLGVENLRGSGAIAGETARAYKAIVTLTLVVGRSVGIGAYLVRLGHRTIQKAGSSPIILTGYQALNKLLGKNVYTSNDQLGGPEIMYPNGVSHAIAADDLDAVRRALDWLAYVPATRGTAVPRLLLAPFPTSASSLVDPVDRPIAWAPRPSTPYDPRELLAGVFPAEPSGGGGGGAQPGDWVSGFFDRGSFTEALAGWAKTVVVGRARLGGVPCGCIVTENRTASAEKPADPADPSSSERVIPQAGGVWFPDSAHKTAQAIADFDAEDLPLFIFANWRGFSGGQRDMFDEILKFGAQIVDRLVAFTKPVFVYIPPLAELRGGAWVVVDPTINADVMEMYAAADARGGVLEPAGLVEIKFRERDLVAAMHRLDPALQALDADLAAAIGVDPRQADRELEVRTAIADRQRQLKPVYTSFAVHFADLHDTPGRMAAKGVIEAVVPWPQSRAYFARRLRRRLAEFHVRAALCDAGKVAAATIPATAAAAFATTLLGPRDATAILRRAFGDDAAWASDDDAVLAWLQSPAAETVVRSYRSAAVENAAAHLAQADAPALARGLAAAASKLSKADRDALKDALLAALQ